MKYFTATRRTRPDNPPRMLEGGKAIRRATRADRRLQTQLIDRELRRASRHGQPFTVLAFRFPSAARGAADLERMEALIRNRVRATDSVGWLGPREFVILARYTEARDAMALAEEFCKRGQEIGITPSCTLYPFPPEFENASDREVEQGVCDPGKDGDEPWRPRAKFATG